MARVSWDIENKAQKPPHERDVIIVKCAGSDTIIDLPVVEETAEYFTATGLK